MINAKQARFLGLSLVEKKIIDALGRSHVGLTVTTISQSIDIPRTTVTFCLNKLQQREWVDKIKSPNSRYPLWKLAEKTVRRIFTDSPSISSDESNSIRVGVGQEQILAAYEQIAGAKKAERVYVIQGKEALVAAVKNLETKFIEKSHTTQKKKPVILEGLTAEICLPILKKMTTRWLKSHWGRATIIHLVPDQFMDFDVEFFIFRDRVLIIQPSAKKTFYIQDANVAKAFQLLTRFIERQTPKINLNDYIEKLIVGREKTSSR